MNKIILQQAQELAKLWGGFRASRVVLTANNYEVFEHLRSGKTADEIAGILGTDNRATEILLDALTALGLLRKTGPRYRNAPVAKRFLVKGGPAYQGDMLRHADTLWKNWSGLDDVLKTGSPNRAGGRNHDAFIKAMHNNAVLRVKDVIDAVDLRGVKRALDLGGGPGTYTVELAKRGISAALFDLPNTIEIARTMIRPSIAKKIHFREGDFHINDIGKGYDLVFISQVFHSFSEDENRILLKKVHEALNPKGRVVIHEFYLDKNRAFPPLGALFSINMLVNTSSGRSYAPQEMKRWLSQTGFKNTREKMLNDTVLVTGVRK
ncbi:MAG: methyltransferase [Nitrospirota bacterium]